MSDTPAARLQRAIDEHPNATYVRVEVIDARAALSAVSVPTPLDDLLAAAEAFAKREVFATDPDGACYFCGEEPGCDHGIRTECDCDNDPAHTEECEVMVLRRAFDAFDDARIAAPQPVPEEPAPWPDHADMSVDERR